MSSPHTNSNLFLFVTVFRCIRYLRWKRLLFWKIYFKHAMTMEYFQICFQFALVYLDSGCEVLVKRMQILNFVSTKSSWKTNLTHSCIYFILTRFPKNSPSIWCWWWSRWPFVGMTSVVTWSAAKAWRISQRPAAVPKTPPSALWGHCNQILCAQWCCNVQLCNVQGVNFDEALLETENWIVHGFEHYSAKIRMWMVFQRYIFK